MGVKTCQGGREERTRVWMGRSSTPGNPQEERHARSHTRLTDPGRTVALSLAFFQASPQKWVSTPPPYTHTNTSATAHSHLLQAPSAATSASTRAGSLKRFSCISRTSSGSPPLSARKRSRSSTMAAKGSRRSGEGRKEEPDARLAPATKGEEAKGGEPKGACAVETQRKGTARAPERNFPAWAWMRELGRSLALSPGAPGQGGVCLYKCNESRFYGRLHAFRSEGLGEVWERTNLGMVSWKLRNSPDFKAHTIRVNCLWWRLWPGKMSGVVRW